MNYLEINDLNLIKKEIIKFYSIHSKENANTHIVIQSLNGYELNLKNVDKSTKELHSFISNVVTAYLENKDVLRDDLVFLITSAKLSLSENKSLEIKNINNLEEAKVQENIEIKYKENLLNLIKV
tara:strand:- start:1108 stop:1482 length:375 start_codon:yes stop_codon:yes gene_type:complete